MLWAVILASFVLHCPIYRMMLKLGYIRLTKVVFLSTAFERRNVVIFTATQDSMALLILSSLMSFE